MSHEEGKRVSLKVDQDQIRQLILHRANMLAGWGTDGLITRADAIAAGEEIIRLGKHLPDIATRKL